MSLSWRTASQVNWLRLNFITGGKHATLPTNLFQLGWGATILEPLRDKDGPDTKIRFNHQLLNEYFASLEVLRRFEAGEDLRDLWKAPRLAFGR